MDPYSTAFVELAQLAFLCGLVALLVGLPAFLWLLVRACRDLRAIREALEYKNSEFLGRAPAATPPGRVKMLSQFGR